MNKIYTPQYFDSKLKIKSRLNTTRLVGFFMQNTEGT
jgi:hypothetical protein